jgi:hypothetical protein
MKILPIIKCVFAHLVLLNCKFRHTKMLFSDHQKSVKSSPKSRKWHFRDSKFKNFLGSLALAFSPPIKKSFPRHCNPNRTPNRFYSSTAKLCYACPDCARQLLSNLLSLEQIFSVRATSNNFFLFEQLCTILLVVKNGMSPSFSHFRAYNGLTKKSDNVSS